MPKKTNLDPSNLPAEDPEFVQFAGIFGRYFYGCKWLDGELYAATLACIGFPTSLEPKDAAVPLNQLAMMFRHYLPEGTKPNPEVLMSHLTIRSQLRSSLVFMVPITGERGKVLEALKQHLHKSFCAALEEYRIRNPEKSVKGQT